MNESCGAHQDRQNQMLLHLNKFKCLRTMELIRGAQTTQIVGRGGGFDSSHGTINASTS
jgi:hypothetical protein